MTGEIKRVEKIMDEKIGWNLISAAKYEGTNNFSYYIWTKDSSYFDGWRLLEDYNGYVEKLKLEEIEEIIKRDKERYEGHYYLKVWGGGAEIREEIKRFEEEIKLLREII